MTIVVLTVANTTSCSSFIGKMDTLRWTKHMEECLEVLDREKEFPLDDVLVALIRLQLVAEDAQKLLVRDVMGDTDQTPTFLFKKSLLLRLQTIRDSMPAIAASNCMFPSLSMITFGIDAHQTLCRHGSRV